LKDKQILLWLECGKEVIGNTVPGESILREIAEFPGLLLGIYHVVFK